MDDPGERALEGKVAIVTGGARGMGFHFATALAQAGCAVLIQDLQGAGDAVARLGGQTAFADGDISSEADVARMAALVTERFGRLDILVNNAAIFTSLMPTAFEALTVAEWDRLMAVNVRGPFLASRAAVPLMRASGGGRIVNIASTVAHSGLPQFVHYTASKGAVVSMTRAMARELAPAGILVNAIAPGYTMTDGVQANPGQQAALGPLGLARRSIKRDQVPADLVGTLLFLCGSASAFITGQTISVDGGGVMT